MYPDVTVGEVSQTALVNLEGPVGAGSYFYFMNYCIP